VALSRPFLIRLLPGGVPPWPVNAAFASVCRLFLAARRSDFCDTISAVFLLGKVLLWFAFPLLPVFFFAFEDHFMGARIFWPQERAGLFAVFSFSLSSPTPTPPAPPGFFLGRVSGHVGHPMQGAEWSVACSEISSPSNSPLVLGFSVHQAFPVWFTYSVGTLIIRCVPRPLLSTSFFLTPRKKFSRFLFTLGRASSSIFTLHFEPFFPFPVLGSGGGFSHWSMNPLNESSLVVQPHPPTRFILQSIFVRFPFFSTNRSRVNFPFFLYPPLVPFGPFRGKPPAHVAAVLARWFDQNLPPLLPNRVLLTAL